MPEPVITQVITHGGDYCCLMVTVGATRAVHARLAVDARHCRAVRDHNSEFKFPSATGRESDPLRHILCEHRTGSATRRTAR